jgi:CheY-like chemotaxis protein
VIVTDMNLPMYDGLAVIKAIRGEKRLADLRVVALTGVTSQNEELALLELGVSFYRSKPHSYEGFIELAQDIAAICGEGKLGATAS